MRNLILAFIFLLVAFPIIASGASGSIGLYDPCASGDVQTRNASLTWAGANLDYTISFDKSGRRVCINAKNKGEKPYNGSVAVHVDNRYLSTRGYKKFMEVRPGESQTTVANISGAFNLFNDSHKVFVSVGEEPVVFTFNRSFNASSPDVLSPYISDVNLRRLANGSTELLVDVHNPSKRGYALNVQVETFGTKGDYRIGAPQENETQTFRIPLEEGANETVAGVVRVFDEWGEPETKFDQKEFMGRPGKSFDAWDVPFERVPGTEDTWNYHNETAAQYRAGYRGDGPLSPLERRLGAVAVVLFVVGGVWWRRRRKFP